MDEWSKFMSRTGSRTKDEHEDDYDRDARKRKHGPLTLPSPPMVERDNYLNGLATLARRAVREEKERVNPGLQIFNPAGVGGRDEWDG